MKRSGVLTLVALIVFIFLEFRASATESVNLKFEDLPKLIKDRNLSVKGAGANVQAAQAQTGHLFRSYLPEVEAEVGGESFQRGPFGTMAQPFAKIEANINLFRGGKDRLESQKRHNQKCLLLPLC